VLRAGYAENASRRYPAPSPPQTQGADTWATGYHRIVTLAAARLLLIAALRRDGLDDELAQGVRPWHRPLLAVRARRLASERNRRMIARSLRRCVAEATSPAGLRAAAPIDRGAVRESASELLALASRLESDRPAGVTGLAIAQRLVTDGVASPLYGPRSRGTLSSRVRNALAWIDEPA
jgi:hypothetical protein